MVQHGPQLGFDAVLQGKRIELSEQFGEPPQLRRIGFATLLEPLKGCGRPIIDAPFAAAFYFQCADVS
jgi:hypothetical protein